MLLMLIYFFRENNIASSAGLIWDIPVILWRALAVHQLLLVFISAVYNRTYVRVNTDWFNLKD